MLCHAMPWKISAGATSFLPLRSASSINSASSTTLPVLSSTSSYIPLSHFVFSTLLRLMNLHNSQLRPLPTGAGAGAGATAAAGSENYNNYGNFASSSAMFLAAPVLPAATVGHSQPPSDREFRHLTQPSEAKSNKKELIAARPRDVFPEVQEHRWIDRQAGRADGRGSGGKEERDGEEHAQSSGARVDRQGGTTGRWRGEWKGSERGGSRTYPRNQHNGAGRTHRNGDFRRDTISRDNRRSDQHRYWRYARNVLPAPYEKFVFVSYNILADKNAAEHYYNLYDHIPWWLMNWERRKIKLVKELGLWSPDIMCLQEVDKFEELREEFEPRGYLGAYTGRTGGALDGCAIFWKKTRFRLLKEESIQFNELRLRDNVAQLCVFQSTIDDDDLGSETELPGPSDKTRTGTVVIVCNIHVLFNPKRGDVKLGQVRVLLESAYALSKQWGDAPIAIAGDFNSTPMRREGYLKCTGSPCGRVARMDVSELYKNGVGMSAAGSRASLLDLSDLDRTTMSGQVELEKGEASAWTYYHEDHCSSTAGAGPGSTNGLRNKRPWTAEELIAATGTLDCSTLHHNLNLRSAYPQIEGESGCRDAQGEPLVTTFHKKFMGTVDYIWHTEGMDTLKVLDTIPVNILRRSQGLPSQKWGSDHLAIACEFAIHGRKAESLCRSDVP